ncbi:hypothetical protein F6R98_06045 [Candidatus Methylospira mobilis]|uniref:Uncharacterized protein n=1 Tax=Candidatus Methylospira mobilis TaxID=1808979 RepID=A0A5Q0BEJ3_9GAMM|nr:hypothetical protein [Candidatus Methylospira mobilis]QFY42240.1 hypothetical protein F6R98_06045 [Candidatus Methylospira mobilis]WNV03258.1 hypothetical protein RP726_12390 [Candidatus Methylospira mobilis]
MSGSLGKEKRVFYIKKNNINDFRLEFAGKNDQTNASQALVRQDCGKTTKSDSPMSVFVQFLRRRMVLLQRNASDRNRRPPPIEST